MVAHRCIHPQMLFISTQIELIYVLAFASIVDIEAMEKCAINYSHSVSKMWNLIQRRRAFVSAKLMLCGVVS